MLIPNCAHSLGISEEGEQHAPSERRDAAAQSLLAPIPIRLAYRRVDEPAGRERGTGRCKWEDDGPRAAPRRTLRARTQGARVLAIRHHA